MSRSTDKVLAISGGVGGAKLALGLSGILAPEQLLICANTGDDFSHLGLRICPDLDTVMYTLAGISNQQLGWGLADESWQFMAQLSALGGEDWFRLGDRDVATHVLRSHLLASGMSLSAVMLRGNGLTPILSSGRVILPPCASVSLPRSEADASGMLWAIISVLSGLIGRIPP